MIFLCQRCQNEILPRSALHFFFFFPFNLQSAIEAEMFCPEETSKNICLLTRSLDARVARQGVSILTLAPSALATCFLLERFRGSLNEVKSHVVAPRCVFLRTATAVVIIIHILNKCFHFDNSLHNQCCVIALRLLSTAAVASLSGRQSDSQPSILKPHAFSCFLTRVSCCSI